jgi:hypothetical protein
MRAFLLALALWCVFALGCYTTTYYNLGPEPQAELPHTGSQTAKPGYWRNFWLFGWVPSEMRIDAAEACGDSAHIAKLETEATFVQGLISAFAGYVINIYSPYTARVVCDHPKVH